MTELAQSTLGQLQTITRMSARMLSVLTFALLLSLDVPGVSGVTSESKHSDQCPSATVNASDVVYSKIYPVMDKVEAMMILVFAYGSASVVLALIYNAIRKHIFQDANNLDSTFDAGGQVSWSLTAVTIASQLLWPGDLLQCTTVAIKNGIAGSFWYTTSAVINMILFPVLSVQFKTRAPGAKTFLQVIHARYGDAAHWIFCIFAMLTNVIVVVCLLTACTALLQALVEEVSSEFGLIVLATLFGSYSFIGGLGSTFYVSYFNTVVIIVGMLVFVVQIFYRSTGEGEDVIAQIYRKINCLEGPERNLERSYFTFWSEGAIIWAIQAFSATASLTFCDQASWQSRIAAKPFEGVVGFFVGTYIWFAIPSVIGTTMGLAYLAETSDNSSSILSDKDINEGLVSVFMAQLHLGVPGSYLILTMLIMAVMSTGSGEVMAISSILVYDIYQTHIRPFKRVKHIGMCLLCGENKIKSVTSENTACECPDVSDCLMCQSDLSTLRTLDDNKQRVYLCLHHGDYRAYRDSLLIVKSSVIMFVTISMVPLGMFVDLSGVDLNYVMLTGFILTTPSVPPTLLTILWAKTSRQGVIIGSLSGLGGGLIANLVVASTYPGGLSNFQANTSHDYSVLAGSTTAFGLSLVLTVAVSLFTHQIKSESDELAEWQKLRNIDNPLSPWENNFQHEFPHLASGKKPSYQDLDQAFKTSKRVAYVGGAVSVVLFLIIIPGSMAALKVLTESEFRSWVIFLHVWVAVMAIVVIVVAPVEEFKTIFRQIKINRGSTSSTPQPEQNSIQMKLNEEQNGDHVTQNQDTNQFTPPASFTSMANTTTKNSSIQNKNTTPRSVISEKSK